MNPYEAPQSSLEPEKRPRVPVKYEQYDTRGMVRIILVIILVLIETILGVLLLHLLTLALLYYPDAKVEHFDEMLPYLIVGFMGIGWILWKLKHASDRQNS